MNRLSQWALNITAGIFFFFFFLVFLFPFESIIRHFLSKVEMQTGGAYRVTVGEIKPGLIFKTKFKNFQIHHLQGGNDELWVDLPEVRVGLSYFPLLTGTLKGSFVAQGKNGEMGGGFSLSKTEYQFVASIKEIQFIDIPYFSNRLGVPLQGSWDGKIDLTLDPARIKKNKGNIDLKLKKAIITAGRITPYPGFDLELPETTLSNQEGAVFRLVLNEGKLDIQDINLNGEDLSLNLKGKVQLNNSKIEFSRINANGSFRLSKKLQDALPFIIILDKQKAEDGSYPITLSGRIVKPQVQVGTFDVF